MLKRLIGISAALSLAAVFGRVLVQRLRRESRTRQREVQEDRRKQPEPDQIRTELEYGASKPEVSPVVSVVDESKTSAEAPHDTEDKPVDPAEVVTDSETPGEIQDPKGHPTSPAESVETERSDSKQESEVPGHSDDNAQRGRFQPSRREPLNRGGHPRGSNQSEPAQNPSATRQPDIAKPRAHLCVWMESMEWQLGVEVSHKTEQDLTVRQGGHEIEQDDFDAERWLLTGEPGAIEVLDGQDCVKRITDLAHELVPLVFRLTGDLEHGVQVKQPTSGAFLLLVPSVCREPVLSPPDTAAVAESTSLSTFRAYFIEVEHHSPLTVQIGSDYSILFNAGRRRFSISGTIIEDDAPKKDKRSSRQGKLYGQSPPVLADSQNWDGVSTIIIGEEGRGQSRWRDEIDPRDGHEPSKQLKEHLAEKRAGWFFLRFYDNQGDLIESVDFRYAISVIGCRYGEGSAMRRGPDEVTIEHQPGTSIRALRPKTGVDLCEEFPGGTRLRIPRERTYDRTEWTISDLSGSSVSLHLDIPRNWWYLGNDEVPSATQWIDKLVHFELPDFRATKLRILHLSVRKRGHRLASAFAGFDRSRALQYPVSAQGKVQIPLREFSESAQLSEAGRHIFKCWLPSSRGERETELELGSLELIARCSFCKDRLPSSRTGQIEHCLSKHFGEIFEELSYEEIVRRNPNLNFPRQIYCCSHCREYVRSQATADPSEYANNAIFRHLESEHPGKPHAFRVVSKSQEVRRQIIKDLPQVYRCTLCKVELEVDSQAESDTTIFEEHLRNRHASRIVQVA